MVNIVTTGNVHESCVEVEAVGTQAVLHNRWTLGDDVRMTKTEVTRCLWPRKDQLALEWPLYRTVSETGVNVWAGQSNFVAASPYGPLSPSIEHYHALTHTLQSLLCTLSVFNSEMI